MPEGHKRYSRNFAIIALAASGIAAFLFALVIVPFLTTTAQEAHSEQEKRIVALDSKFDHKTGQTITKIDYVKVGEMQPNSAFLFLDPFGRTMEGTSTAANAGLIKPGTTINESDWAIVDKSEAFEFFTLIRLPEWLGGSKDDISAYRAHSAIAISDQCLSKYWGTDGRWRIENPCAGDLYRPWDGVATGGPAAVGITGRGIVSSTGYFNALASLNLSVDSDGYITAIKPDKDYFVNGVPGEGRRFTPEIMRKSNEEMINAASEYVGYRLPFVPFISASQHYLSEIRAANEPWWLEYPDYRVPVVLEAMYFSSPSGGDFGYEEIVIRSYPLDAFPSLSLDSPKMTNERIDLSEPDLDRIEFASKLNQTVVNSLIHLDWYDNSNSGYRATESGTGIVGNFSVFTAPLEEGGESVGAGALIWGKSIDGKKDILVTIRANSMDMDQLVALAKSLQIKAE